MNRMSIHEVIIYDRQHEHVYGRDREYVCEVCQIMQQGITIMLQYELHDSRIIQMLWCHVRIDVIHDMCIHEHIYQDGIIHDDIYQDEFGRDDIEHHDIIIHERV
jgi:hypothetical protein